MSYQEFFDEDDHVDMVANWIDASVECEECHGNGCRACEGLGRIALCDLPDNQ